MHMCSPVIEMSRSQWAGTRSAQWCGQGGWAEQHCPGNTERDRTHSACHPTSRREGGEMGGRKGGGGRE